MVWKIISQALSKIKYSFTAEAKTSAVFLLHGICADCLLKDDL